VTDGEDYGQPGQYPPPGYGQQNGRQGQPRQPRRPQYGPRHQRGPGGPQEAPWQEAPYPPQEYPPQNYPQQNYPPQAYPPRNYPPQEYPNQSYPPQGYPSQDYPPQDYPPQDYRPQDYSPRDQWQRQQPEQDYGQVQTPQRHHGKRSRTPLYAGAAALIVIAGGGTAYALAGHGGTPSHTTGGTTQAATKPASLSQLKKIVLQPADLPSGWKGTAHQSDPNDSANNAALMRCVGARDTDSDKVAEANSDDFDLSDASISSSATSYRSQSDLTSDVATLHSPKLSACFGQMMKKELAASLPAGATTEAASIKVKSGSAGGPANVVATGTGFINVKVSGQQISVYLTVAFITGPLIEAEVDTENVGKPVPASVVNPLVAKVATRAAKG
jgi:hypothetical protein